MRIEDLHACACLIETCAEACTGARPVPDIMLHLGSSIGCKSLQSGGKPWELVQTHILGSCHSSPVPELHGQVSLGAGIKACGYLYIQVSPCLHDRLLQSVDLAVAPLRR